MWLKLVLLQFTENLQFLADGRLPHVCGYVIKQESLSLLVLHMTLNVNPQ